LAGIVRREVEPSHADACGHSWVLDEEGCGIAFAQRSHGVEDIVLGGRTNEAE